MMSGNTTDNAQDLTVKAFTALQNNFFDSEGNPTTFHLREKRNTQDDPFDEYVHDILEEELGEGIKCEKSSPLVSPDLALVKPANCNEREKEELKEDLESIVATEVKKLERNKSGSVARSTGLDYNTTPPCGTVRVYDSEDNPVDIRGFYLFVCLEESDEDNGNDFKITALALCDGNVLNRDFEFYKSITGEREKEIELGTYKDGIDRQRPMLVFPNPLGASEIDHSSTLIHPNSDLGETTSLEKVYNLIRTSENDKFQFYCYRFSDTVSGEEGVEEMKDPFPTPSSRGKTTQSRGKFNIDFL